MASKTIGKRMFDWSRILARVPAESRGEYLALRAKYEALQTNYTNLTEQPTTIDWTYYQSNIAKSAMVADFKRQFEQLKVPFPQDTDSVKIEDKKEQMEQEAVRLLDESKKRVDVYKAEVERINNLKPIEDMTVEEYMADKPEMEARIDWEFENYEKMELEEAKQ